jgi:hypothetical protein
MRLSFVVLALLPASVAAGPPVVQLAVPVPELDALFQRTDGWIGGDAVYSVLISPTRTLWLFNDTWVGKVRDGRRTDATMVNNTVGVQDVANRRLTYSIGRDRDGKAVALIVPADGRGWFWPQAGAADGHRLSIFLRQVEKTQATGAFAFRSIGMSLGTVADAGGPPESWRVEQAKMPNVVFSPERNLMWGAAVLRLGDDLYVYGADERPTNVFPERHMVVARTPAAQVADFAAWRYYRDGGWTDDFHLAGHLADGMATEYSVTPFGSGFLAVYTELGLSPRIMGRTGERPWGPWSAPVLLYQCPEMGRDRKLFCYAAKAHPSLSSDREVVISYVVNSFDFWQVARQAELYWPRFVRVTLAGPK